MAKKDTPDDDVPETLEEKARAVAQLAWNASIIASGMLANPRNSGKAAAVVVADAVALARAISDECRKG